MFRLASILGIATCLLASAALAADLAPSEFAQPHAAVTSLRQDRAQEGVAAQVLQKSQARPDAAIASMAGTGRDISLDSVSSLQAGFGNHADILQGNSNNRLELLQQGNQNAATYQQLGNDRGSLQQFGNGNRADVYQARGGPPISIRQTGNDGFIRATQF